MRDVKKYIMNFSNAATFQVITNLTNEALVLQQLAILAKEPRGRGRKEKNFWVRPWLAADRRLLYGQYATLMDELGAEETTCDGVCYA